MLLCFGFSSEFFFDLEYNTRGALLLTKAWLFIRKRTCVRKGSQFKLVPVEDFSNHIYPLTNSINTATDDAGGKSKYSTPLTGMIMKKIWYPISIISHEKSHNFNKCSSFLIPFLSLAHRQKHGYTERVERHIYAQTIRARWNLPKPIIIFLCPKFILQERISLIILIID